MVNFFTTEAAELAEEQFDLSASSAISVLKSRLRYLPRLRFLSGACAVIPK
jgi:hypothetical protein